MAYLQNETGAVTVDWVVLTAGLVGLGLATMSVVSTGVQDTSGDIDTQLRSSNIITSSFASGYTPVPCSPSTADEIEFSDLYCAMNSVETLTGVQWGAGDANAYFAQVVAGYHANDNASLMAQIDSAPDGYLEERQAFIDQRIALIESGASEAEVLSALNMPATNPFTGMPIITDGDTEAYLMRSIASAEMNMHFQTTRIAIAEDRGLL